MLENIMVWDVLWKWIQLETLMSLKTLTILAYFLLLMDFGYNYFIKEGGGIGKVYF